MIEISSDFTQMVKDSQDYKLVSKGGKLYVLPASSVETVDWTRPLTLDYASVLTVDQEGDVIKSRYGNTSEAVKW